MIEWIYALYAEYTEGGELLSDLILDGGVETVRNLWTNIFSLQAVNQLFKTVKSAEVIQVMLESGCISSGSITAAFRAVTRCGSVNKKSFYPIDKDVEVARQLLKECCIPPQVIRSVFVDAAKSRHEGIVNLLRDDQRLNSQTISKVFRAAAANGHLESVKALRKHLRIAPEVAKEALVLACKEGHGAVVLCLVEMPSIARSTKEYVFLKAARKNWTPIVQLLCKKERWPRGVLTQAVYTARDGQMKKLLRRKLAKQ